METPTDEKKANDELIVIAGGVDLEVTRLDGTRETVKVRQIPISKFNEYIRTMGDEAGTIELYTDRKKEWIDTLDTPSAFKILDTGQELNLPFLQAWFRRQAKWRKAQDGATGAGEKKSDLTSSPSVSLPPQSPTTTT